MNLEHLTKQRTLVAGWQKAALEALAGRADGLTFVELKTATKLSRTQLTNALQTLQDLRKVESVAAIKNNQFETARYRLARSNFLGTPSAK